MTPEEPVPEVDALQRGIAHTRAELGETVEALAAKTDVKARAERATSDAASRVRATARDVIAHIGTTAGEAVWQVGTSARDAATRAVGVGREGARRPVSWLAGVLVAAVAVTARVMKARAPR